MSITVLAEILLWSEGPFGYYKTKEEQLHEVDAWCIAVLSLQQVPEKAPEFDHVHEILQFRRQDRSIINAQTSRRYYHEGKKIAKNRKKRKGKEKIPFRNGENDRLRDMEKNRPEK